MPLLTSISTLPAKSVRMLVLIITIKILQLVGVICVILLVLNAQMKVIPTPVLSVKLKLTEP